jgi:hypothetical protein
VQGPPGVSVFTKPGKPRADFSLYAHRNEQLARKIKGKTSFFGKWEDPDSAMQSFVELRAEIHAGRDPKRQRGDGITVADVVNHYLESPRAPESLSGIREALQRLRTYREAHFQHFGRREEGASLRAADLSALRQAFPPSWGITKTGLEIQRIRSQPTFFFSGLLGDKPCQTSVSL